MGKNLKLGKGGDEKIPVASGVASGEKSWDWIVDNV